MTTPTAQEFAEHAQLYGFKHRTDVMLGAWLVSTADGAAPPQVLLMGVMKLTMDGRSLQAIVHTFDIDAQLSGVPLIHGNNWRPLDKFGRSMEAK